MPRRDEWREWLFDASVTVSPEASAILAVSVWSICRLRRSGLIEAQHEYAFGPVLFFTLASLAALTASRVEVGEDFAPDQKAIARRRRHAARCLPYNRAYQARRKAARTLPKPEDSSGV
jgi:hypothetical protein